MKTEEYKRILDKIELSEIVVGHCKVIAKRGKLKGEIRIDLTANSKLVKDKRSHNVANIFHRYELRLKPEKAKTHAVSISIEYILSFSNAEGVTEEFFEIYRENSLVLNTWPYFREFVANMCYRIGIPLLTIPLFKVQSSNKIDKNAVASMN